MKGERFKRFSLETLHCRARAFPAGTATRLVGDFKIYSAHNYAYVEHVATAI